MTDDAADLRARLDRLERTVQALSEAVAALVPPAAIDAAVAGAPGVEPAPADIRSSPPASGVSPPPLPHAPRRPAPAPRAIDTFWHGERWLNKAGIALLVLGVGFLGKYAIDRGWTTPAVRVVACFLIGAALFAAGVRVHTRRRALAQVLLGGGLAAFYVTGFVAFQLYALVPYAVAFAFLTGVTALAFASALRQGEALLAVVGTLGGLATPFLLYRNAGTITGLIAYTSAVVAGVAAIHAVKRWRALLWTALVAAMLVLGAAVSRLPVSLGEGFADRVAVQLGLAGLAIAFWALPVSLAARDASRGDVARSPISERHVHLLPVVAPAFALGGTIAAWSLRRPPSGWLVLGGALVLALVAAPLFRDRRTAPLGASHAVAAAAALTWALFLLLDDHAFLGALALEGLALHVLARRLERPALTVAGHVVVTIAGLATLARLIDGAHGPAAGYAVANLSVVVLTVAASWLLRSPHDAGLYRFAAHAGWLFWLWRTLGDQPGGKPLVTIAWGIDGAALLPLGLRASSAAAVKVGFGTLVLAIGKLVLLDLAELGPLWRIGLFLGFGAALLAVSYFVPSLWRPLPDGGERPGAG